MCCAMLVLTPVARGCRPTAVQSRDLPRRVQRRHHSRQDCEEASPRLCLQVGPRFRAQGLAARSRDHGAKLSSQIQQVHHKRQEKNDKKVHVEPKFIHSLIRFCLWHAAARAAAPAAPGFFLNLSPSAPQTGQNQEAAGTELAKFDSKQHI
jgi:hypothetical protein